MRKILFATAAIAVLASAGNALAENASTTFNATATTQAAISVTCNTNLRFGTVSVYGSNAQATITVAASNGATATSSSSADAYPAAADSGPADCTISNETGSDATAALSGASGSFAGTTLSGAQLTGGVSPLSADIELGKAAAIGNETIYIGGTLTIPANHTDFATYSGTITLTVTD